MASLTDISLVAQVAVLGNRRAFDEPRAPLPVTRASFLLASDAGR